MLYGWRKAMLVIRRCPQPPDWFRERALAMWTHSGDHIRCEVGDDLLVADALRVLLPGYEGPAMRVWRGESAWNRRRRTYGLSWSKNRHVAEGFARGQQGFYRGGCVVVETDAPPEAVICTVPEDDDGYAEKEVLIDRRWLNGVRLITRYSQRLSSGYSYDR